MEEIIRTNQELRKQLAEDDEIISEYKTRIKSLERDLEYCS
jgi:chromosome segregation ATPase